MTNDDSQQGGPEWERNKAAKKIADALQSGDPTEIEQGASDLGDAVVNAMMQRMLGTLKTTFDASLKQHIQPLRETFSQNTRAMTDLRAEDYERRKESEERFVSSVTALGGEVEKMTTALEGVRSDVGKLQSEMNTQGQRLERVEGEVSGLSETQGTTEAKVDGVIDRVDVLEGKVESVIVTQRTHGETLAQHGELLEKINRQYTDLSVLMVHMDFLSEDRPQPPEVAAIIRRLRDATPE